MPELRLSIDNLKFALSHLQKHKNSSIFPHPFAFNYIDEKTLDWMSKRSVFEWMPSQSIKMLSPKISGDKISGFRTAVQLDPLDTLFYTALTIQAGEVLEKSRIPISENIVFSYRFEKNEDNSSFYSESGYSKLLEQAKALASENNFVIQADIANFFPSIYLHDIEQSINDAMGEDYTRAFSTFFKRINVFKTVGVLPVSTKASMYISNIVLNDLDKLLIANGIKFCRFADDFRIFTASREEAYQKLYALAQLLQGRLNLNLQESKTVIWKSQDYLTFLELGGETSDLTVKTKEFKSLLAERVFNEVEFDVVLYIDDEDENQKSIEYDELDDETKGKIDQLHFQTVLEQAFAEDKFNYKALKDLLFHFSKIKYLPVLDIILDNFDKSFPVTDSVMRYLSGLLLNGKIQGEEAVQVKQKLMNLISENSYVSHIPFYKVWILEALSHCHNVMNTADESVLVTMFDTEKDLARQSIIKILGQRKCKHWFRSKTQSFSGFNSGEKLAFLLGYKNCGFPADESNPFLKSIKGLMDEKNMYGLEIIKI